MYDIPMALNSDDRRDVKFLRCAATRAIKGHSGEVSPVDTFRSRLRQPLTCADESLILDTGNIVDMIRKRFDHVEMQEMWSVTAV